LKNNDYSIFGYLPKLSETIGLFPEFENNDYLYDFYGGITNGLAEKTIKQLNSNPSKPWFFIVHSMDLHQPISISKDFDNDKFGKNIYEKKLNEIDYHLGKIIEKINFENTILIVTSDHGDYIKSTKFLDQKLDFNQNAKNEMIISKFSKFIPGALKPMKDKVFLKLEKERQEKKSKILKNLNLPEHEERALLAGKTDKDHFLFDELIKVPFLICGNIIPKNLLIEKQIRSVDMFPTIFEFLGIKFTNEIDGVNLKPLIDGMDFPENPAYIESNPLVLQESNDVIGIRTSTYKYFRDKDNPKERIHLFNLKDDPFEENNLSSDINLVEKYEKILDTILKSQVNKIEENSPDSDEIEKELRKLGYV
tara:strand:+ start:1902 stop:2996 length:1095 start_codon:yes stop_codon:yes gene_type:complete